MLRSAFALCTLIVCLASVANAQPVDQRQLAGREIRVQVIFTVPTTSGSTDPAQVVQLQSAARRLAYETVTRECQVLMETIAAECRLESLNVSSQASHGIPSGPPAPMHSTTNATYRVVLKAQP